MSMYGCAICDEPKDKDADGYQDVEGETVCQACYDWTITRLLENHGIEDDGDMTLEDAKETCGVSRIIRP